MDLKTTYLGFELPHPLMPGSSPLTANLDSVKRLEDAGAPAIVMHSLFEEQILREQIATTSAIETPADSSAEAITYLPQREDYRLGPDEHLALLRKVKAAVRVPVIGSLNGITPGGWLRYARLLVDAGADALELNVYQMVTDPKHSGPDVERQTIELVREVKRLAGVPVAVKLSPFYSALPHFVHELEAAGADGIVLFNRFYQPDIDVEKLEVTRALELSESGELLLRLRWLAVLSGRMKGSLAVSGGVHTTEDAVKSVMAGAHAVQIVSAILQNGPEHLRKLRQELSHWLESHEYHSLAQMQGSMNLSRSPNPSAYERANYVHILQGWERAGEQRQKM
ncbi:MAG: dihydroorotate dehydrogenase-like protein [Candidatus Eisenbacteria bacterium]|nr:dihydroorotate dehydrogenase-like protein [Candidatus Eisenbacteria bacterium]